MFRIEGVLNLDGDIFYADGIDGWRVDNLCTEVAQLHRLYVRKFVNGISALDDFGVGGHETIDIGPDLQHLSIQYGSKDRSGIVGTATSQVGCLVSVTVAGNEAGNDVDFICCDRIATHTAEGLLDELGGLFGVDNMLALLLLCADEVAAVHTNTILHHRSNDMGTEALSIGYDGVFGLLRQIVNQVNTIVDTLQLIEELVYIIN